MQCTLRISGGEGLAWTAAHREDVDLAGGGIDRALSGPDGRTGVPRLLLTPEEAAQALGIGRTKLYRLLAEGFLPSIRIGGSRRISTEALDRFVHSLEPAARPGGFAQP